MIIAIDPGHGKHTAGKRFPLELTPDVKAPNFVPEWEPNQQVATRLCRLLEQYKGVKVVRMDDPTGETDVNIHARPRKANKIGADAYISIHHNADGGISNACGIVVFAYDKTTNPLSIKLMNTAYRHLIQQTGMKGNRWSGTQKKNLCVLRESRMAAILCELGFMTNPQESKIIRTPAHYDQCARALCDTLVEVYNLQPKSKPAPAPKPRPVPEEKEDDDMSYEKWMEYKERYEKEQAAKEATMPKLAKEAEEMGIFDGRRPRAGMTREEGAVMNRRVQLNTENTTKAAVQELYTEVKEVMIPEAQKELLEALKKIVQPTSAVENPVESVDNSTTAPTDPPNKEEA